MRSSTGSVIREVLAGVAVLVGYILLFCAYWAVTDEPNSHNTTCVVEGKNNDPDH